MSLSTGVSSLSTAVGAKIKEIITTLSGKQATLVSGTNIKTINGSSVLGSGDLTTVVLSGRVGSFGVQTGIIAFDEFWVNQGGIAYNVNTKNFTIPSDGIYRISFDPVVSNSTSNYSRILLGKNTVTPSSSNNIGQAYSGSEWYNMMSINSVVHLNTNDYIVFYIESGSLYNTTGDRFNQFSIIKIG